MQTHGEHANSKQEGASQVVDLILGTVLLNTELLHHPGLIESLHDLYSSACTTCAAYNSVETIGLLTVTEN